MAIGLANPIPKTLIQLKTCGVTSKKAVFEAKPGNAEELWNVVESSWAAIPAHRCQESVDSM